MNFENRPTHSLRPYPGNARTHSPKQIKQIARSIERFGFNNPVLVDDDDQIIAGHGRVEAAKLLNMKTVPTVRLSHLSQSEKKAYILADNRLAEKAGWDNEVLAIELQGLVDLGFDVLLTGFEPAEVDIIIEGIGDESEQPENLVPEETSGPAVSRLGDVWMLGEHILVCGDSTDAATYKLLMDDEKAEFRENLNLIGQEEAKRVFVGAVKQAAEAMRGAQADSAVKQPGLEAAQAASGPTEQAEARPTQTPRKSLAFLDDEDEPSKHPNHKKPGQVSDLLQRARQGKQTGQDAKECCRMEPVPSQNPEASAMEATA